jgi:hypothetical protein
MGSNDAHLGGSLRQLRGRRLAVAGCCCAALAVSAGAALAGRDASSLAASPARGEPSFAKPQRHRAGALGGHRLHSDGVAVADLNSDGKRDLAVVGANVDAEVSGVSVLLNRGARFGIARAYRTGDDPSAVASGDMNGDGAPELATANGEDVSVLFNRGDGRFSRSVPLAAREPWDVAIGDVSGDGKADIVTANHKRYVNTVSVYANRGDGSFQPRVDYRIGRVPIAVALADLNRDGSLDIAAACQNNTVSVLLNRGDGTYPPRVDYAAPRHPRSIAIADMNGDRSPDLVTANTTGDYEAPRNTVSVFMNSGDGSFGKRRVFRAKGAEVFFGPVAVGDLNVDGRQDVAVGLDLGEGLFNPKRAAVLLGRGDGSFTRRLEYRTGSTAADAWAPRGIAVGDVNGDGKPDLVQAKFIDVAVLLNRTRR